MAYEYDGAGRLVKIGYYEMAVDADPAKTVSFTYNKNGELTGYDDGTTSAAYTYDALGRKTGESLNYGSFTLGSGYEYYANGLKKSFTNADGVKYTYTYDAANRLSGINIPDMGDITYNEYEWAMPKKITLPGGTVKTFEYDPLMQVKGIMVKDPADNILMNYSYTRDKEGNILSKVCHSEQSEESKSYAYQYDKTYQLLKTIYPDGKSEEFTYDPAGNRLQKSTVTEPSVPELVEGYTHNKNNEMLTAGNVTFEFDDNGNMVKKVDGANTFEYIYNLENRLSEVKLNTHTLATYGYDPFGRRLWKEVGGVRNYFFYTDEGLTAEVNASGEVVKTYGYTPNSIWTTDPLFTREGGQYYFYHNDHLATPQMLTSSNGIIVWNADYESFGKATVGTETITNNLRFPGQYFDGETGMHQNWHRTYMLSIGKYMANDRIGFKGRDYNLFRYSKNNPINHSDFDGKKGLGEGKIWGNYCGDNWCGGGERDERDYPIPRQSPINSTDSMDQCCKQHDACLGGWDINTGVTVPKQPHSICDPQMAKCMDNVDLCNLMEERPDVDPNKLEHIHRVIRNAFARLGPFGD